MGRGRNFESRPDISLALGKVDSDKLEFRLSGLLELRKIINDNRQSRKLKQVDDKGYHAILETIFRVAKIDISGLARATKYTSVKISSRLSACGSLVRTIVDVGLVKFRYKTLKALVEHISQSLPTADAGYCEPLLFDYFKALATLLEYRAHVEHLSSNDWHELLEFCIETARDLNRSVQYNGANLSNLQSGNSSRSRRVAAPSTPVDETQSFSSHDSQRLFYPQLQGSNEDILLCLRHLVIVPSAPVASKVESILNIVLDLLKTYPHRSKIQHILYEILDSILSRIVISDTSSSLRTVGALIPLIVKSWPQATFNQRKLMLSILLCGESLLSQVTRSDGEDATMNLVALLKAIKKQYCDRKPREQLQIEQLDFSKPVTSSHQKPPLSVRAMSLRPGTTMGEEPWCVIHVSASIYVVLEETVTDKVQYEEDDFRINAKRHKRSSPMDELLQDIRSPQTAFKVYALQVLAFAYEQHIFEPRLLQDTAELLMSHISNDDSLVVSWAIFAVANLASHAIQVVHITTYWPQIWRLIFRKITSSSTCGIACQGLAIILEKELVIYPDVADLVDSMLTSSELNGPSVCDGASTRLWVMLLRLRRQENLQTDLNMSNAILRWLYRCWNPARQHDRLHTAYIAQNVSIPEVINLICLCFGMPLPRSPRSMLLCLGRLSQTRLVAMRDFALSQYLLQEAPKPLETEHTRLDSDSSGEQNYSMTASYRTLSSVLIEFLIQETSSICSLVLTGSSEPSSPPRTDVIHVILQLGVVGFGLLSSTLLQDVQNNHLFNSLDHLRNCLKLCILEHDKRKDSFNAYTDTMGSIVDYLSVTGAKSDLLAQGIIAMAKGLDQRFWETARADPSVANGDQDDLEDMDDMDMDVDVGPQVPDIITDANHNDVEASTCADAFRAAVIAKVCYASSLNGSSSDAQFPARNTYSIIIEYLTSLERHNFLLSGTMLRELLSSDVHLLEDDADSLLQYIQQAVVKPYELGRSEVSIGICVDTLAALAHMWTMNDSGDVAAIGAELYVWFSNKILSSGTPSPVVLSSAANLLQQVIKVCPDYAKDLSSASARTTLLQVLRDGNLYVKYKIGNRLPEIFGLFVLKEHASILEDIIDSLPSDPAWIEGIALRIDILSKLAAAWPTLLRRCTYAIFETAGHVQGSAGYARLGLNYISDKLKLSNSKELFKLFAPQLIYTWVETQPVGSVPFEAFDYANIKSLLMDIRDEAVGQTLMRGKTDEMEQIAADLQTPFEELLVSSFSKSAAYSIGRDIAIPPSDDSQAPQAEARLRKLLGREKYAGLVTERFAEIVALFFTTADYEDQIQKAFQKTPAYSESYTAYQKIIAISASDKTLPPNQQPSFKAKYLLAELEHLCSRTPYDVESLWTPTLYVFIFRTLINSTHSALGSLHTCSILRKIRILICMAGRVALEAYPLEMALHALRPFLTDALCTDDVVGLVQYLLQHGAPYLEEAPKLLLGHAVVTLISMKTFLSSSQDSTTQESHFRTTISCAKAYHDWLLSFLMSYKSPHLSTEATMSFQAMAKAAGNIRQGGSARKGTHESDLLMTLLNDLSTGRNILPKASQSFLLEFLSASFEVPQKFHDDILGDDKQASQYASTIWDTCRWKSAGPKYLMWSGRVLGRAYASQGLVDTSIVHETSVGSTIADTSRQGATTLSSSRIALLHLVSNLLMRDSSWEVGLAELALSHIVTQSHLTEYALECEKGLEPSIYRALLCLEYDMESFTTLARVPSKHAHLDEIQTPTKDQTAEQWIKSLTETLALRAVDDPLMASLSRILNEIKGLAEETFPFILHLALLRESGHKEDVRLKISRLCCHLFDRCESDNANTNVLRPLLNAILYLRTQPLPNETSKTDRARWLDLDFGQAARAAYRCSMHKTALMFLEIEESERAKAEAVTRRKSKSRQESADPPVDLLLEIYQQIDEQDAFYGVKQPSSLLSMMSRLEYEHAGFKSLSFRGAFYDGQIRQSDNNIAIDQEGMVRALNDMDLNGLSQPLVNNMIGSGPRSIDAALSTARKLEQWDISPPSSYTSNATTIFEVFRKINNASENEHIEAAINIGFAGSMHRLLANEFTRSALHSSLSSLAILTEVQEVFSSRRVAQLEEVFSRFRMRDDSLQSQSYNHIKDIISCRETTFSCLSKRPRLQELLKTSLREARLMECRMLLASSSISRSHGALQNSLSTATYLNQIVEPCKAVGVNVIAATQFESSHVLWSQGETTASIRLLRELSHNLHTNILEPQSISVGRPEMLAKLGHHTAEARLQKPETIIQTILKLAVKELNAGTIGDEAGEVFHEFASFCDQQLQNPDSLADFKRIQRLRERKEAEVRDLDRMIKSAGSQTKEKENLRSHRNKAHQWFKLDDGEYQRLDSNRLTLVKYSLENYLLCLKASDKFDNDALRFSALWLENNENSTANETVAKHMPQVPSRKFAPLMNQWTSRLMDVPGQFQGLLFAIIQRVCIDHPYHGMYQIFAVSKTKGGKDETALARHAAANNIVEKLRASTVAQKTWINVHNTNVTFVRFAQERLEDSSIKPGSKVSLRKTDSGRRVEQDVLKMRVPPPTMSIDLRADCNYDNVTVIAKFQSEFTLAGGISMPKIVTALGTDGIKYKQLFKGGNDDLRQDAIMEQVFGAVSALLKAQRATRQRDLRIRTYKVLPLTATSGVIEFVSNTIPLHDYLLPAHQRHYPKDLKPSACRKHIQDAQSTSTDNRIKVFRKVCEQFHPVLRYFFQERFESPDDWFDKRLAYTRSTAAISILGHILGLGDRHGHNILLDERTGEVVHIDLGIAFEQGRVLPVPEVVPFRLTRDLVDGMGITGTEGVFRRCCEFTLEALRNESYSIMTILDVLRYDPLYSWSLSPLRLKKMQDAQTEDPALPADGGDGVGKKVEEDAGEAERALLVVGKKLSRTLSVQATVNELIQQATDERNLAVLFCGWAAYA